jgi:hypothetical protein
MTPSEQVATALIAACLVAFLALLVKSLIEVLP